MTEADRLLDDLDRLAASADAGDAAGFYAALLDASSAAIGAPAAEWRSLATGGEAFAWPGGTGGPLLDRDALLGSAASAAPRCLPPIDGRTDSAPLAVCPVVGPTGVAGVLAWELAPEGTTPVARTLEAAGAIAEVAERYEARRAAERMRDAARRMSAVDRLTLRLHAAGRWRDAAAIAADGGRELVAADRLTVLRRAAGGWRVEAVSGVANLRRRSDAARAITRLANAVPRGDALRLPVEPGELPPPLAERCDEYLDASGVRTLRWQPAGDDPVAPGGSVALLAEWYDAVAVSPESDATLGVLTRHAAVAACRGGVLGSIRSVARRRWWAAIGVVVAAALLTLAALTPVTLWVSVEGEFEPGDLARVFAPRDAVVRRVLVGDAASVKRGQPLVELDSAELRIDRERIEEEIAATESEIAAARAAELRRALRPSSDGPDESALAATLAGLRERLKRQHERRALLDAEAQRLVVRSPAAGTVVSWRPEETLVDRPVRRGQRLLEVVGGDAWRLRLPVPDRRSGPVLEAAAASTAPLRVRYVVRSDPSRTHEARVAEIAPTSHPDASGASVVRVVATPAGEAPPLARDGLAVTAKIDCGRQPTLYAWLHEAIAAVRRLWF